MPRASGDPMTLDQAFNPSGAKRMMTTSGIDPRRSTWSRGRKASAGG